MAKCEYCGKEVLLPFKCPYCGGLFCAEHRLPEKHECLFLPKKRFWYQKQRRDIERKEQMESEKLIEKPSQKSSGLGEALKEAFAVVLVLAILIGGCFLLAVVVVPTENPALMFFGLFGILFLVFFIIFLLERHFER